MSCVPVVWEHQRLQLIGYIPAQWGEVIRDLTPLTRPVEPVRRRSGFDDDEGDFAAGAPLVRVIVGICRHDLGPQP